MKVLTFLIALFATSTLFACPHCDKSVPIPPDFDFPQSQTIIQQQAPIVTHFEHIPAITKFSVTVPNTHIQTQTQTQTQTVHSINTVESINYVTRPRFPVLAFFNARRQARVQARAAILQQKVVMPVKQSFVIAPQQVFVPQKQFVFPQKIQQQKSCPNCNN